MDGVGQRQAAYRSSLTSEMAAATDSRMDISRHMQVPDKIYVSESHTSTPTVQPMSSYRASTSSTPMAVLNSSGLDASRPGHPAIAEHPETGMNVPRRIMMNEMSAASTPVQPYGVPLPAFAEPSPLAADRYGDAAAGRRHETPMRPDAYRYDRQVSDDRPRPSFRGPAVAASPAAGVADSLAEDVAKLNRRVAVLEGQANTVAERTPATGGASGRLYLAMHLAFWLLHPALFAFWKRVAHGTD